MAGPCLGSKKTGSKVFRVFHKRKSGRSRGIVSFSILLIVLYLSNTFICSVLFRLQTGDPIYSDLHKSCASRDVLPLHSFDDYSVRSKSFSQNEFQVQDRKTDRPWEIVIANTIFPSMYDASMNLQEFGNNLQGDIHDLRRLITSIPSIFSDKASHLRNGRFRIKHLYRRMDRLRGIQYLVIFEIAKSRTDIHAMHIQQPLGSSPCKITHSRLVSSKESVYILLPFTERRMQLRVFIEQFLFLRQKMNLDIILIVSVLRNSHDIKSFHSVLRLLLRKRKSDYSNIIKMCENDGDKFGKFSRSVSLREAAKHVEHKSSVLFMCDIDLIIHAEMISRCEENSIPGKQVFYPILYNLYSYGNKNPRVASRNGFWRTGGFGMVCIRKGDFFNVGAFDDAEERFQDWGLEDIHQYEKIRESDNLIIFRAVEPGLFHLWHPKECRKNSTEYSSCMNSNFMVIADPIYIGKAVTELLPKLGMGSLISKMEFKQ